MKESFAKIEASKISLMAQKALANIEESRKIYLDKKVSQTIEEYANPPKWMFWRKAKILSEKEAIEYLKMTGEVCFVSEYDLIMICKYEVNENLFKSLDLLAQNSQDGTVTVDSESFSLLENWSKE